MCCRVARAPDTNTVLRCLAASSLVGKNRVSNIVHIEKRQNPYHIYIYMNICYILNYVTFYIAYIYIYIFS